MVKQGRKKAGSRIIKIFLWSVLALCLILGLLAGIFLLAFDPDKYGRIALEKLDPYLQAKIVFERVHVRLFPLPGLAVEQLRLYFERPEGEEELFSAETALVHITGFSILNRWVKGHVRVLKPTIQIAKGSDGIWNVMQVAAPSTAEKGSPATDLSSLLGLPETFSIRNLGLSLEDGRVELRVPGQGAEGYEARLKGLDLNVKVAHDLTIEGEIGSGRLSFSTQGSEPKRLTGSLSAQVSVKNTLAAPHIQGALNMDDAVFGQKGTEFTSKERLSINLKALIDGGRFDLPEVLMKSNSIQCAFSSEAAEDEGAAPEKTYLGITGLKARLKGQDILKSLVLSGQVEWDRLLLRQNRREFLVANPVTVSFKARQQGKNVDLTEMVLTAQDLLLEQKESSTDPGDNAQSTIRAATLSGKFTLQDVTRNMTGRAKVALTGVAVRQGKARLSLAGETLVAMSLERIQEKINLPEVSVDLPAMVLEQVPVFRVRTTGLKGQGSVQDLSAALAIKGTLTLADLSLLKGTTTLTLSEPAMVEVQLVREANSIALPEISFALSGLTFEQREDLEAGSQGIKMKVHTPGVQGTGAVTDPLNDFEIQAKLSIEALTVQQKGGDLTTSEAMEGEVRMVKQEGVIALPKLLLASKGVVYEKSGDASDRPPALQVRTRPSLHLGVKDILNEMALKGRLDLKGLEIHQQGQNMVSLERTSSLSFEALINQDTYEFPVLNLSSGGINCRVDNAKVALKDTTEIVLAAVALQIRGLNQDQQNILGKSSHLRVGGEADLKVEEILLHLGAEPSKEAPAEGKSILFQWVPPWLRFKKASLEMKAFAVVDSPPGKAVRAIKGLVGHCLLAGIQELEGDIQATELMIQDQVPGDPKLASQAGPPDPLVAFSGPASIRFRIKEKSDALSAIIVADASKSRLRYKDLIDKPAEMVCLTGLRAEGNMDKVKIGKLFLNLDTSELLLTGEVKDVASPTVDLDVKSNVFDLGSLSKASSFLSDHQVSGTLKVSELKLEGPVKNWREEAKLKSSFNGWNMQYERGQIERLLLNIAFYKGALTVSHCNLDFPQGSLSVKATYDFSERFLKQGQAQFAGGLEIKHAELHNLIAFAPAPKRPAYYGTVNSKWAFEGTGYERLTLAQTLKAKVKVHLDNIVLPEKEEDSGMVRALRAIFKRGGKEPKIVLTPEQKMQLSRNRLATILSLQNGEVKITKTLGLQYDGHVVRVPKGTVTLDGQIDTDDIEYVTMAGSYPFTLHCQIGKDRCIPIPNMGRMTKNAASNLFDSVSAISRQAANVFTDVF